MHGYGKSGGKSGGDLMSRAGCCSHEELMQKTLDQHGGEKVMKKVNPGPLKPSHKTE